MLKLLMSHLYDRDEGSVSGLTTGYCPEEVSVRQGLKVTKEKEGQVDKR